MTAGGEISGNRTEWEWTATCASCLGSEAFYERPTCLVLTGKLSLYLAQKSKLVSQTVRELTALAMAYPQQVRCSCDGLTETPLGLDRQAP